MRVLEGLERTGEGAERPDPCGAFCNWCDGEPELP